MMQDSQPLEERFQRMTIADPAENGEAAEPLTNGGADPEDAAKAPNLCILVIWIFFSISHLQAMAPCPMSVEAQDGGSEAPAEAG